MIFVYRDPPLLVFGGVAWLLTTAEIARLTGHFDLGLAGAFADGVGSFAGVFGHPRFSVVGPRARAGSVFFAVDGDVRGFVWLLARSGADYVVGKVFSSFVFGGVTWVTIVFFAG